MQAIIIGAGRGQRLMPTTADAPKCFAEVGGQRILDWTLAAFHENGIGRIRFIGGYQIDKIRQAYPQFSFCHNREWERNNILASLFCAEEFMDEPFICCYSDILFTSDVIARLLASDEDLSLVVDTHWLSRYEVRTLHPPDDAEKVIVRNGVITRIHRDIDPQQAHGEYIGVAQCSAAGAARLREHYHRCCQQFAGQPFREASSFEKAYLIHLFQEMVEAGERLVHVDTSGGYIEIDTQQDFDYARRNWK
jgi:L-glutamine-phosphate cytidylyltransferase